MAKVQSEAAGTFQPQGANFLSVALAYSLEKIRATLATSTNFPEYTNDDRWTAIEDDGWTGAFWTGQLWLASAFTDKADFEAAAREWTYRLAPRQYDTTTHDLGFLFRYSYMLGEKLTGDPALKPPALQAAQTLTLRFNQKGGYIQAWGPLDGTPAERGRIIIDSMMNLALLYWASKESGDPRFAEIATTHAKTMLTYNVRLDGSTAHVADFNPDTGEFIKQDTHQGLSATSCWSRGQAWAIFGFSECYSQTGNEAFLKVARRLADYFIQHLPEDNVPYWDFNSPLIPNDVRDSSAAAIAASGLLLLAEIDPDADNVQRWRAASIRILESLWIHYSSVGTTAPSILLHGTRHKPYGFMDQGLIYGDYYFLEAITRLLKPQLDL